MLQIAGAFSGQPGRSPLLGLAICHDDDIVAWLDAELMADERESEAERETEQDRGAAATRTRRSDGVGRRRAS